ncbi:MAG: hypothetical protein R3C19_03010 [Planctomycetaceae bacterium]
MKSTLKNSAAVRAVVVPGFCLPRMQRRSAIGVVAMFIAVTACVVAAADDDRNSTVDRRRSQLQEQHQEILRNLRFDLTNLSQQCFDRGQTQAAADVTAISLQLTTDSPQESESLPRMMRLPVNPALPPEEKLWRERLHAIREDYAADFYRLARAALRAELPSLAYAWVQDVIRIDPDHRHARMILGQQAFRDRSRQDDPTYAGEWVSPFEARMRSGSRPHVFDSRFGWIPQAHLQRYEDGERPWGRNWVSVEKEAELRRNFRDAWEIESEHFLVKTNTSREEGVQLSLKLETFDSWVQTHFAAFFDTPQALEERFEQASPRRRASDDDQRMTVHYYALQSEYNEAVRDKIPANLVTNGLYWEPNQTSYFYRSGDLTTLFHEGTHQVLDIHTLDDRRTAARLKARMLGSRNPTAWTLCENSNFWVIEGPACYFESFQIHENGATVGDPANPRFVAAIHRLLAPTPEAKFYLPLQEFCSLGKDSFQNHPNVAQLYSQASGVTHFLMHYDDGRYRDDLVRLLSAVYRPNLKDLSHEPSLEEITGVRFEVLDQQYRDHMETLAIQLRERAEKNAK